MHTHPDSNSHCGPDCNCHSHTHSQNHHKPKIEYPCEWEYRIIGTDEELLKAAAEEILTNRKYNISFANISKTGKYISLSLKTVVETEEIRNNIYIALRSHTAVKSIL